MLTVPQIVNFFKQQNLPNLYPDDAFIQAHKKIIAPFIKDISVYDSNCFREINNFLRFNIIKDYGCDKKKVNNAQATGEYKDKIKIIANRLRSLFKILNPLAHDLIANRRTQAIVGFNKFTGKFVLTHQGYSQAVAMGGLVIASGTSKNNKFVKLQDLELVQYFKNYTNTENPRNFIYSFTGLTTTTTIPLGFSTYPTDDLLVLRVPQGTRVLLPLVKDPDRKQRIILAPDTNFVIYSGDATAGFYFGAICTL